jgi:hypothetical protein
MNEKNNYNTNKITDDYKTIADFGLSSIQSKFSIDVLIKRIEKSNDVLMLVIRNAHFFKEYSSKICKYIINRDLHLTILMLNPSSYTPHLLVTKFYDISNQGLSQSIKDVINLLIKGEIYNKLPENCKENIKVRLSEIFPVYSAYIFDDEEVWFVPYFFRPYRNPVPVFVLKGKDKIKNNEIYLDIKEMERNLTIPHDLNNAI